MHTEAFLSASARVDCIIHSANQVLVITGNLPKRGAMQGDLGIIQRSFFTVPLAFQIESVQVEF
jgi:hypothetical protein